MYGLFSQPQAPEIPPELDANKEQRELIAQLEAKNRYVLFIN